jgi:hypothetical protein
MSLIWRKDKSLVAGNRRRFLTEFSRYAHMNDEDNLSLRIGFVKIMLRGFSIAGGWA